MSQYEVFSSPNLLSYLAKYLRHSSCTIAQEDSTYYLHSSDIDYLCSSNRGKPKRYLEGLLAVLALSSTNLGVSVYDETECVKGLLFILNGSIKLKYREYRGLARDSGQPTQTGVSGKTKTNQGIQVYKDLAVRANVQSPIKLFRDADKQPPTMKKIWRIARYTPSVARALFYYALQEDEVKNLRSVIEEIMKDTYKHPKQSTPPRTGKIRFDLWLNQGWTLPEVGIPKMEDFWAWIHNPDLSKDKALHSVAFANKQQAITTKARGSMTLMDVREIIRILLMKWITQK